MTDILQLIRERSFKDRTSFAKNKMYLPYRKYCLVPYSVYVEWLDKHVSKERVDLTNPKEGAMMKYEDYYIVMSAVNEIKWVIEYED